MLVLKRICFFCCFSVSFLNFIYVQRQCPTVMVLERLERCVSLSEMSHGNCLHFYLIQFVSLRAFMKGTPILIIFTCLDWHELHELCIRQNEEWTKKKIQTNTHTQFPIFNLIWILCLTKIEFYDVMRKWFGTASKHSTSFSLSCLLVEINANKLKSK